MHLNYKLIILFIPIFLSVSAQSMSNDQLTTIEEKRAFLEKHAISFGMGADLPEPVTQAIMSMKLGTEILSLTGNKSFNLFIQYCRTAIQMRNACNPLLAFENPEQAIALSPIPVAGVVSLTANFSQLPIAERMYLLHVRSNLHNSSTFASALKKLDELTKLVQTEVVETRTSEATARAIFLVEAVPFIRTVTMEIHNYLQFILAEKTKLQPSALSRVAAWVSTPAPKSPIEIAQQAEVDAREKLAYAAFDSIFGAATMPDNVDAAASLDRDDSAKNRLQKRVQALFGALTPPFKTTDVIVDSRGEIITLGTKAMVGIRVNKELNDASEFIVALRTATAKLLETMNAATQYSLIEQLFKSAKNFKIFTTAEEAKVELQKAAADGFESVDAEVEVEAEGKGKAAPTTGESGAAKDDKK